jgi:putative copper export protein
VEDALSYAWVPKAIVLGLAQLGLGIAVARWLASPSPSGTRSEWDSWLARLGRAVAGLLAAALIARLWVQTASAFGPNEAFKLDNLQVIALESRWGAGWRMHVIAGAAMLASAWLVPAWRFGSLAFAICAVAVVLAMPLLGHAAGSLGRYGIHAAHGLGAAAWIGTLGVITLAAWRRTRDSRQADLMASSDLVARIVPRFSPLALTAAALVAASGVLAAWFYVGSWASLVTSAYGRLLVLKLVVVAGVGACGWANWREIRSNRLPTRALITLEYIAALFVVALTGVLTETEHP